MRTRTGRVLTAAVVYASLVTGCSGSTVPMPGAAVDSSVLAATSPTYATTIKYVTTFYPLWFTYYQSKTATGNRLVGPNTMSPLFHVVVAPNDDTLYCSSFLSLSAQPLILTVPSSKATWSLLSTDAYGNVFNTGITAAGTYALVGPTWSGSLPGGVSKVVLPNDFSSLIIRSDRFSPTGTNQIAEARKFRDDLRLATLSTYDVNHDAGPPLIVPVAAYDQPYKTVADDTISRDPIKFLGELQTAVASSNTPAMTSDQKKLSDAFDKLFGATVRNDAAFEAGARRAHSLIIGDYLAHLRKTNWITMVWTSTFKTDLDRSAITEFIQYGNDRSTAAYYQAFNDGAGNVLDGSGHQYVLTFNKSQIPQAKRFWSVTLYIPGSITLYRNTARKYLVGSYTPHLVTKKGGSISIYISNVQPKGAPGANWLPAPKGVFNLMLRVYGPEGSTLSNTYTPPPVVILR